MSVVNAPIRFAAPACFPPVAAGASVRSDVLRPPPGGLQVAVAPLRAGCGEDRRHLRNAVGHVGVKLAAAPDAPPRGQVLVRTPVGRISGGRRCATPTLICPSREFTVCAALAKGHRGRQPRPAWRPVSCGGGGQIRQRANWRKGQVAGKMPARAMAPGEKAAHAAGLQRDSGYQMAVAPVVGRTPGKDPS